MSGDFDWDEYERYDRWKKHQIAMAKQRFYAETGGDRLDFLRTCIRGLMLSACVLWSLGICLFIAKIFI